VPGAISTIVASITRMRLTGSITTANEGNSGVARRALRPDANAAGDHNRHRLQRALRPGRRVRGDAPDLGARRLDQRQSRARDGIRQPVSHGGVVKAGGEMYERLVSILIFLIY
jgi:hypothetical protein